MRTATREGVRSEQGPEPPEGGGGVEDEAITASSELCHMQSARRPGSSEGRGLGHLKAVVPRPTRNGLGDFWTVWDPGFVGEFRGGCRHCWQQPQARKARGSKARLTCRRGGHASCARTKCSPAVRVTCPSRMRWWMFGSAARITRTGKRPLDRRRQGCASTEHSLCDRLSA